MGLGTVFFFFFSLRGKKPDQDIYQERATAKPTKAASPTDGSSVPKTSKIHGIVVADRIEKKKTQGAQWQPPSLLTVTLKLVPTKNLGGVLEMKMVPSSINI